MMASERARILAEQLARNPDGVLERIAAENGVSTRDVVEALPDAHRTLIPGHRFRDVMSDLERWGEVLVIVHTPDVVLECVGRIPTGNIGRGYFNLHGDSPIGGHIRYEACATIAFVSRPFMGRPSCSVQFFNSGGDAMFKVFVRRDK
ncbi:MAG: heme utilization cystosolic carrier protein HutX, partial [Hyphomicrobiaceae bacterium]